MKNAHDIPRAEMPAEFHIGSLVIPAVYVRLAGIAATLAVIWLVSVFLLGA